MLVTVHRWGAGFVVAVALTACGQGESEGGGFHFRQARTSLVAASPRGDLVPFRTSIDDRSRRHVRLRQMHHGIPVVGGEYVACYDAAGRLVSSRQTYVDRLDALDVTPRVAKDAAVATSIAAVGGQLHDARLVITTPRRADEPLLAWEVLVRGERDDYRVEVDAQTGRVVQRTSVRMNERGSGQGVFGDVRAVEYVRERGQNFMIDESRSTTITVLDAKGGTSLERAEPFTSPDGRSWDTRGPAAGAAVDAAYHVGLAIDYFKELGREGWDDRKHDEVPLLIHYGRDFANAQYSPLDRTMHFGDGGDSQYPLAAFLDIVAHEYTHGVTASESDLDYAGESGALNEAISDIFGAIVEHHVRPNERLNWLHGEGSLRDSEQIEGADRDFTNPHDSVPWQPAHLDELVDPRSDKDNGGVHSNSGIINHAAYLMTVGGTNPVSGITVKNGIGWKKLAKLFYELNTDYLQSRSDFKDAVGASLDAARELEFSDIEIETIQCAWQAVGLLDGTCDQPEYHLSSDDAADEDDDVAGDDTKAKSSTSKAKKSARAPSATPSCAMGAPGAHGGAWLFLALALVARTRAGRR